MSSSSHAVIDYLYSLLARHGDAADDDGELLRRFVAARDDDAFAALLRRHGPMVLGLARRVTGDGQIAEDVFQATFLLLARKARTIRRPESLPCWLHGVAHRLALQARRSCLRRREREARIRPSSPLTPLDELTARELLDVLDEELQALPEKYRGPLILCCLEGLSQEEAAKRLGCSSGAVKGRLERGRDRLRLRLQKRGLMLPAVLGGTLLITDAVSAMPPALFQATLTAAKTGGGATPAAILLMQGAMRVMFLHKLKLVSAAIVLLGITGGGLGMMALHPRAAREGELPAAAASDDKPMSSDKRVDLYGDPLPKGVVMRLGTLQRRAVGAQLAVTTDGKSIVAVRDGKYITIWDATTGKHLQSRQLLLDDPDVFAWSLSPDGRLLATSDRRDGKVTVWDVRSGKAIRELVIEKADFISDVAFSPDGKRLAVGGRIGRVFSTGRAGIEQILSVWQLSGGKEIFSTNLRHYWTCDSFTFSRDGKLLIVSFSSKEVGTCCWDLDGKRQQWQNKEFSGASVLRAPDGKRLSSMLLTPDGKLLSPYQSKALDLATGKPAKIEHLPTVPPDRLATLSPDGRTLLFSTAKGATVWDMERGKELRTLAGAGEQIVFLLDGKSVITSNGSLQRWDLATGKSLWTDTFAQGHVGEVVCLAFSADGRRLVSGSLDGSVRLWDARTGRPLRVWRGHEEWRSLPFGRDGVRDGVWALDISADGRRIVSAGSDECIKLWDAASDGEVHIIPLPRRKAGEPKRSIHQVRISPDGRRIIAFFIALGSREEEFGELLSKSSGQVVVWDTETETLLEKHPTGEMVDRDEFGVLSPDARTLFTRTALIDVMSAKKWAELPDGSNYGGSGTFSRDGALVAGGAQELVTIKGGQAIGPAGVRVWEAATGKIVARLKTKSWVAQTVFHPDNRFVATSDLDGIHLHDVRGGKIIAHFQMPESIRARRTPGSYAGCLAFTADGRRLATGHPDGTILLWDVPLPASQAAPLAAKDLESLWDDLASTDAAKAWRAVWRMAEAPKDALPFLRDRIKPIPTEPAELMRKLVADLDDDSFARREAAMKRLKVLGWQAEPFLRAALQAKPTPEQRRRIEALLAALSEKLPPLSAEEVQQLRALILLGRIGSPEARRMLEDVAKGPESAHLTRQARAVLQCVR